MFILFYFSKNFSANHLADPNQTWLISVGENDCGLIAAW